MGNKAYYVTHREERLAYQAAYNAAHREEQRAYSKVYYATHREECLAYAKAYYERKHNLPAVPRNKRRRRTDGDLGTAP